MKSSWLALVVIAALAQSAWARFSASGTVLSATNVSNYTYVYLETDGTNLWIAGPKTTLKAGDALFIADAYEMKNFYSPTQNLRYESIWFTGRFGKAGDPADPATDLPSGHPPIQATVPKAMKGHHANILSRIKVDKVPPLEDGLTIADILARSEQLSGKRVSLRARVVKVNTGILKRNWIRLSDGSGEENASSVTATSTDTASVGNVVRIEGTVQLNRSFGAGYDYPVLLEECRVVIENQP